MERKQTTGTVEVTTEEVRTKLSKAKLAPAEERVLRMRHGVAADRAKPLPRAAGGNAELEDELLVIEMQLMRQLRARAGAPARAPEVQDSKTKDKIVRALRRKK
jgi:hypothetical protein